MLHPADVLVAGGRVFPALAACEHYAGSEKLLIKSMEMQNRLGPVFDITADCEDGAPAGREREHAQMIAEFMVSESNRHDRMGLRIHDVRHAAWREELSLVLARAAHRLAYVVLPKPECAADVMVQISELNALRTQQGIERKIPVHVLIETHGALREVWQIAALPDVECLDFGLMDFVSAHHGAIPASAMRSPGQFSHPLIRRAKCEIAAAALGNGIIPSHNVTTEIRDLDTVREDARHARLEFGFGRMWSIHPAQIEPIVEAMRPDFAEVQDASALLIAAQDAAWGPVRYQDKLHDRASFRYYWELLQRAVTTGMEIPDEARTRFF